MLVLMVGVLVLSGCSIIREPPQTMLAPVGSNSQQIYDLFNYVFVLAIVVFVVVEGVLIYSIMRYRRRTSDGIPLQIHGNTLIEIAWTIIPALIVLAISVVTFRTQALIERPTEATNAGAPVRVEVIGHKWWWEFRYPEHGNIVTANELHIPADRDVELLVTSDDVIHSFWVPRLAGKRDAIPNHVNRIVTRPTGEQSMLLRGQCAEFCGKTHAMMGFYVKVDSQADFDAWVAQQVADAPVPVGVTQNAQGQAASNKVAQAALSDQVAQAEVTPEATEPARQDDTILQATADAALENAPEVQATAEAETTNDLLTPEARGYNLFQEKQCVSCHVIQGYPGAVGQNGPNLTHVGSREYIVAGWLENTPENMARWLRDPNEVKPENLMGAVIKRGTLNQEEIDALTAYLQSLE
jgi:cytochrome c oxidase subunit 2